MKKFLLTILAVFLLTLEGLAQTSEFKNILLDLDVVKSGETTFKLILKTEVPYPDEIKVIKKTDFSYYVLLAETFSTLKSTKGSETVKEIVVETYPYAGQNFDNGYTKISFITAKPIDFIVSLSAKKASKFPIMDLVRLARLEELYKNDKFDYLSVKSVQTNVKQIETLMKKRTSTVSEEVKTGVKSSSEPKIASGKIQQKVTQTAKITTPTALKSKALLQKEPVKIVESSSKNKALKKEIESSPSRLSKKPEIETIKKSFEPEKTVQTEVKKEIMSPEAVKPDVSAEKSQISEDIGAPEQKKPESEIIQPKIPDMPTEKPVQGIEKLILALKNNLKNILLPFAGVLLILALVGYALKNRKPKEEPIYPIFDKDEILNSNKPQNENTSDERCVQQEIEGEVQNTSENAPKIAQENAPEDTALNVLDDEAKEHAPIYVPDETEEDTYCMKLEKVDWRPKEEQAPQPAAEAVTVSEEKIAAQAATPQKVVAPKKPVQKPVRPVAKILFKTQIAQDRGLYLTEYLGNKALVGYINNDIFVLYNFKKVKLKNNEIIFRLSEARAKEDLYFVMVDDMKFLIKSDRNSMSMMQKIS